MHRLQLWRTHPSPHQDGPGPRIVEGGPHRGTHTVVAGVSVLAFPLSLALTLTFVVVVGVGGRMGRGRLRTRWFLLWWARKQ
jgi:hypothetical protein